MRVYRLRMALVLVISGILMIFLNLENFIISNGKTKNFNELSPVQYREDLYVTIDLDLNMGLYMKEYTYTKSGTRVSGQEYAIPICNAEDNIEYLIGVMIHKNADYSKMEHIYTNTLAWFGDATGTIGHSTGGFSVNGKLRRMSEKEHEHLIRLLAEDYGIDMKAASEIIVPYVIRVVDRRGVIEVMIVGVVCILLSIGLFAWEMNSRKNNY